MFQHSSIVRVAFAMLLAGALQSCQTLDKASAYEPPEQRQAALMAMQNWQADGRIALTTSESGFSAAMNWSQAQQDFDITLTALLGQRALRVAQQGTTATLSTRGNPTATGDDAEQLLLQELGVRVPLRQLGFWMRGLPGRDGLPRYDKSGRIDTLDYTDVEGTQWTAKFVRYQRVAARDLPALIDVKSDAYKIRVSIKNWKTDVQPAVTPPETQSAPSTGRLQIPDA